MPAVPDGVVWLVSYPKSGNTWIRILLANLLADGDGPQSINALHVADGVASCRWTFESETLLDSSLLRQHEIAALQPAVRDAHAAALDGHALLKVHDAFVRLDDGTPVLGRAARAAVYIARDPRDVAVSLAAHTAVSVDQAIDDLADRTTHFGDCAGQLAQPLLTWSDHVRSWLDQRDVPIHLVRYEDLHTDPLGTFRGALRFLGIAHDEGDAARAVRRSTLAELQRQEREHGFRERPMHAPSFFRSGEVGEWRRRLTAQQVGRIEATHGDAMTRLGYALTG